MLVALQWSELMVCAKNAALIAEHVELIPPHVHLVRMVGYCNKMQLVLTRQGVRLGSNL